MHIEELIIDGFKSYASRVHITGWDNEFSAITGLNGSGKSNILDALCFVLGMKDLSRMRASSLADLVYKRGQAGINKATVTIVFDNSRRDQSPPGYEDVKQIAVTRQLLLTGSSAGSSQMSQAMNSSADGGGGGSNMSSGVGVKNKYMINSVTATEQTVFNLFHSVQLNINHPHFMIQQGQIIRVLNMKPADILGMIEEAAGTRMFEDRKAKALRTLDQKQRKVDEMTTMLKESIEPQLNRLREEKKDFNEYSRLEREIEKLEQFVIAFTHTDCSVKINAASVDINKKNEKLHQLNLDEKNAKRELTKIQAALEELIKAREARNKNSKQKDALTELTERVEQLERDLTEVSTNRDLQKSIINDSMKKRDQIINSDIPAIEKHLSKCEADVNKCNSNSEALASKAAEVTSSIQRNEELLQSLTTGVAGSSGKEAGYLGLLQSTKAELNDATAATAQLKMQLKHIGSELTEAQAGATAASKDNAGTVAQLERSQSELASLESKRSKTQWDPVRYDRLIAHRNELDQKLGDAEQQYSEMEARFGDLQFRYADPHPGFDRNKVKGLVARLVTVPKEHASYATALEICAGGKLYNVVVSDDTVAGDLIQKGRLTRRFTFIPLQKIAAKALSGEVQSAAKRLGPSGKINLALDLVCYEDDVRKAMEYVFGSSFIVDNPEIARKVTFDKNVRSVSITKDGDLYSPTGTLTGGATASGSGILAKLNDLNELSNKISDLRKQRTAVQSEINTLRPIYDQMADLSAKIDMARHQCNLLEQRVGASSAAKLQAKCDELIAKRQELEQQQSETAEKVKACNERIKTIERDMKEFASNKDTKLESIAKDIAKDKKTLASIQEKQTAARQKTSEAIAEQERLREELESNQQTLQEADANAKAARQQSDELGQQFTVIDQELGKAKAALEHERQRLRRANHELEELEQLRDARNSALNDIRLEIQKTTNTLENSQRELERSTSQLARLEREYEWIESEKHKFGQEGSVYDFGGKDLKTSIETLDRYRKHHSGMRTTTNTAVLSSLEAAEKRESHVKTMIGTVIRDKKRIEDTIGQLDDHKRDALKRTWQAVNEMFGQIFDELLPGGNTARLQPPEGSNGDITRGLEIRVNLGGTWKHSLSELSGGQRSLVALSLILAMLKWKPAPLYILDEIDSALDLSHTQSIGRLFATRFGGAQFIVVSLKEGLFTNANVLFRAKFVNGTSMVERIAARANPQQKLMSNARNKRTQRDDIISPVNVARNR